MSSKYHTVRVIKRCGKVRSEKVRPKTFKTEDAANTWAEKQGIKKFSLENLKSPESAEQKIRVVEN